MGTDVPEAGRTPAVSKRGLFEITDEGRRLLASSPSHISAKMLEQYPSFRDFKGRKRDKADIRERGIEEQLLSPIVDPVEPVAEGTPEDALAAAYRKLRATLEADLLEQVKSASPAFFERLVVDLLIAMGYGGSRQDAGRAIGRSGDGGIDGIINEDRLGLDVIYVQAKRWEGSVGRPEIQKFAGALQGQRATKGVFITTSSFTRDAEDYANVIHSKIILMDGDRLASLMVDFNVGVTPVGSYELKKIDSDYFEGE